MVLKRKLPVEVNDEILSRAKTLLCQQLSRHTSHFHTKKEEQRLRVILDATFKQKKSNSVIVIGDQESGKEQFVSAVIDSYTRPDDAVSSASSSSSTTSANSSTPALAPVKFRVARIKGMVDGNDNLAFHTLAKQLYVQKTSDRKFDANLDFVGQALRTSYSQGTPTIIVIEDIHEFVRRKKQLLLYTLFDLMHRSDLLFAVVGITHKADFNTSLEKRVVSRLNAQYVYLSPASPARICRDINGRLRLPESPVIARGDDDMYMGSFGNDATYSIRHDNDNYNDDDNDDGARIDTARWTEYRSAFNSHVDVVFPLIEDDDGDGGGSGESSHSSSSSISATAAVYPGSAVTLIRRYANHGRGMTYYLRAALTSVLHLGTHTALITPDSFRAALERLNPPCPSEALRGCSFVEIRLLAALVRLVSGACAGRAFLGASSTGGVGGGVGATTAAASSSKASHSSAQSRGRATNIAMVGRDGSIAFTRVLAEFDRMTGLLRMQVVPQAHLLQAAKTLESMTLIEVKSEQDTSSSSRRSGSTAEYRLRLVVNLEEVKMAFSVSATTAGGTLGLSIPESLRKAVLNPLDPVALAIPGGNLNGANLM